MNTTVKRMTHTNRSNEAGQAIVLIALALVVLLGFIGLAVDIGTIWMQESRLTATVDSAALAGAPELSTGGITDADAVASKFLATNEVPGAQVGQFSSSFGQTELGANEYSITVTWNVELYFMRVFGWRNIDVTRSATAAYFPLTDIYASARVENGTLSVSNQAVFGPDQQTSFGDPYSPITGNPYTEYNTERVYRYRIYIPADYESRAGTSVIRVEIFDPDSINRDTNSANVIHTERFQNSNPSVPGSQNLSCSSSQMNPCIIPTCEWEESNGCAGSLTRFPEDQVNPFWFLRVDENRTRGSTPGTYNSSSMTLTQYQLYYFRQNLDQTLTRDVLATYTGQSGHKASGSSNTDFDSYNHFNSTWGTDIHWVSPGAFNADSNGNVVEVPTDCGSPNGGHTPSFDTGRCGGGSGEDMVFTAASPIESGGRGFEVNLAVDVPNIVVDASTGVRYLYIDVRTVAGASENGFELWAGPPGESLRYNSNGNLRNVEVMDSADNPRNSAGAVVFAMGRLPMNSNTTEDVQIPLIYVPPEYAGRTVYISNFDSDSGTQGQITFYFDSIPRESYERDYPANAAEDQASCFNINGNSACQNVWVGDPRGDDFGHPAIQVIIPDLTDECVDPTAANMSVEQQAVCTPFYGGVLMVDYRGGSNDTYQWEVSLPSFPYLVR